jgi:hypothetical protein
MILAVGRLAVKGQPASWDTTKGSVPSRVGTDLDRRRRRRDDPRLVSHDQGLRLGQKLLEVVADAPARV